MLTTEQRAYRGFVVWTSFFIFVIVGSAATFTFIAGDRMLNFQHQMVRYHEELINGRFPELTSPNVVIIGDSTAMQSLIPSDFKKTKAISLATSGTSTIEAYYRLSDYLKKNKSPRCVLLMTSYGAHEFHLDTLFWPLTVGHAVLTYDQLMDYYRRSRELNQRPGNEMTAIEAMSRFFSERFQYYVQFGMLNRALFQPNLMFTHPQRSYRIFRRTLGGGPLQRRPIWLGIPFDGPNQEFLKNEFTTDPALDFYFQKILSLTKDRGIQLYLDYGPVARSARTEASERWLTKAMAHLEELRKPYENAHSLLNIDWYADSSFTDSTHLNWTAGRRYSAKVDAEISDCAIETSNSRTQ